MNIITYNVRGLGMGVKWAAIRRLVKKEHVDMICFQETKKEIQGYQREKNKNIYIFLNEHQGMKGMGDI